MCFTNYIGVLAADTSTTGLYLRNLNLTLSYGAGVKDEDYDSGEAMLRDKLSLAIELVKDELRGYLHPFFRFDMVIDEGRPGEFTETLESEYASDANGKGLKITKVDDKCSRLSRLYIEKIRVLANTSGDRTIRITDGTDTTDYSVTLVAGEEQDVSIKYKATRDVIYITWIGSVLPDNGTVSQNCGSFCFYGWDGSGTSGYHHGMLPMTKVICDEDELMCILAREMAFPVLYRWGIEIVNECMETDRINFYTLTDDQAKERRLQRYMDEYEKRMRILVNSLPQLLNNLDEYCIKCNQTRYVETILV